MYNGSFLNTPYRCRLTRQLIQSAVSARGALLIHCIVFSFAALYLLQHAAMPPNAVDGALILDYIHSVAQDERSFWDFIDLYGPLNWPVPAAVYTLADQQVWAVRLWLVVQKLISLMLAYAVVRRIGSRFYGWLCVFVLTILLGQPWQYLQTAYSAHTAFPLSLATFILLMSSTTGHPVLKLTLAGLLTAAVIWIKLNTGAMLLAASLFYCFFWWSPANQDPTTDSGSSIYRKAFYALQWMSLFVFGLVFLAFIREHFNKSYLFYLAAPLLILLMWTGRQIRDNQRKRQPAKLGRHFSAVSVYLSATLAFAYGYFLYYFGPTEGLRYIDETLQLLSSLDYMSPFPPFGVPGFYTHFNDNYWLQLPWLSTLLFVVWLWVQNDRNGVRIFRSRWPDVKARTSAVWLLSCIYAFVMYSRSDETHIFQALLPAVPAIFVLLSQIESFATRAHADRVWLMRLAVAVGVIFGANTIATWPTVDDFRLQPGQWHSPHLRYLKFTESNRFILHQEDIITNNAAAYIDTLTEPGEAVLVLCENQLLNFNSHTVPVGGRYRYIFYLLRNELLDRAAYDRLVPAAILKGLLTRPPRVIVAEHGNAPLLRHFPEFKSLMRERYTHTRRFNHIFIYERNDTG